MHAPVGGRPLDREPVTPTASALPHPALALYACRVMHHRLKPKKHRFVYGLFFFWLDLDELDGLNRLWPLAGNGKRPALYRFLEEEHLPGTGDQTPTSLKQRLLDYLQQQGHPLPAANLVKVYLLTQLNVLGYGYNPVCFYWLYTQTHTGWQLWGAVAEVENTFYEVKLYPVPCAKGQAVPQATMAKHFYVSPFSPLGWAFAFKLPAPGPQLALTVDDLEPEALEQPSPQTVLLTRLWGKQVPLTSGQLLKLTLRYPMATVGVMAKIHYQAFRLWLKGVPFFAKQANAHQQIGVLRPLNPPPSTPNP